MWVMNPLLLREKLWVLSFCPIASCHTKGRVLGKIMSQSVLPVLMWFPPGFPDVIGTLPQFLGLSFGRNCSIFTVDFVCLWEEVSLGSSTLPS